MQRNGSWIAPLDAPSYLQSKPLSQSNPNLPLEQGSYLPGISQIGDKKKKLLFFYAATASLFRNLLHF
ncbi:MAG: hypothetical protein O7A06_03400 [Acidobacteria bacterium]|nr:hypothetical protein [Acidobacteriota bacterium]MCZ6489561.1 hypothetical protein [Acidobacteriota bacterium]MCZ6751860.1 hypothetical protein [Acidobacteriota bacterium]